jgi:hypothetical protein
MVVVNKKDGIYDYWKSMGDVMWQESKFFNLSNEDLFGTKTKAFMFTSGLETEFYDKTTDSWENASICKMDEKWRSIKGSQWIWVRDSTTLEDVKTGRKQRFRLKLQLPSNCHGECIVRADLYLRANDECRISVNNISMNQVYGGASYPEPFIVDIGENLKAAENMIYFEVLSFAKPDAKEVQESLTGLIYRLHLEYRE